MPALESLLVGWLTPAVNLECGVRQGDPLSPLLYILAAEVLAARIKNCAEIKGFLLPGAGGTNPSKY